MFRRIVTLAAVVLCSQVTMAQIGISGGLNVAANFSRPVGMGIRDFGERTGTGGVWGAFGGEAGLHTKHLSASAGAGIWMIGFRQNGAVVKYADQMDSVDFASGLVTTEYKYFYVPLKMGVRLYSVELQQGLSLNTGLEGQFLLKWLYAVRHSVTSSGLFSVNIDHTVRGHKPLRDNKYYTSVNSAGGGAFVAMQAHRIGAKIGLGCLVDMRPSVDTFDFLSFSFVHPYVDLGVHYHFIEANRSALPNDSNSP